MPTHAMSSDGPEQVPCAFHPQEGTRLRCTECERPICPKCMVMYEVGFKCPDCARKRPSHAEQVAGWHYLVAGFGAVLAGYVYGWLHPLLVGFSFIRLLGMPVLAYLLAYGLGAASGNFIQRIIHHKVKRWLALGVGLAAAVGIYYSPPFHAQVNELLEILLASQNGAEEESSAALYLVPHILNMLGAVFFIRGLCRPFQR